MSTDIPAVAAGPAGLHPDRAVPLHPLVYLDEGEEVTVGRADTDVYCVLPADGAALLRRLAEGATPAQAGQWYAQSYGEMVNLAEFVAAMDELGFVRHGGATAATGTPLRWQLLGRIAFSRWAFGLYAVLLAAAGLVMVREPGLAPHYGNIFFTPYLTVIELTLFLGQLPLLLLHEAFHALAGRRIGLRSSLGIGRRLYFVVFETAMDGLMAVPRRRRILPMLAGMLADLLVIAALTLVAAVMRRPDGTMPLVAGALLAFAFGTMLRLVWQLYFFLQTDLYYVIVTVLGCVDLQRTARQMLANRAYRLLRRPNRCADESAWHPRDRAVARWYSWLLLVGYATSLATLILAVIPPTVTMLVRIAHQIGGHGSHAGLVDAVVLVALNVGQGVLVAVIFVRDRRRRRAYSHVIA